MIGRLISDEQWYQYHRDGFLKLPFRLDQSESATLQQRIDDIMLGRAEIDYDRLLMQIDSESGQYADLRAQTRGFKGPSLNYRKIQDLENDPQFLAYMQMPVLREICAYVYGAHASIACYRAMFMNKPASKGTELPWHQDGGESWGLDRDPLVTVWTALDPATVDNGCVEVIRGSHRLGLLNDIGHTITAEQAAVHCTPDKSVFLELEAGEVVLLHNWLLHRSGVNRTNRPRRGFSTCYMDGRTRTVRDGRSFPIVFSKHAQL